MLTQYLRLGRRDVPDEQGAESGDDPPDSESSNTREQLVLYCGRGHNAVQAASSQGTSPSLLTRLDDLLEVRGRRYLDANLPNFMGVDGATL